MSHHRLYPVLQSAYRKHHSTETALLRVHNDILMSMNKQHVTPLVLLDQSAAFDTVNRDILLSCLQSRLGVNGTVLSWFESYLSGRSQRVYENGSLIVVYHKDPAWVRFYSTSTQASCLISSAAIFPTFTATRTIHNYIFRSALIALLVKNLLLMQWNVASER